MTKVKYIMMILFSSILLLLIPNISNAAIDVTRDLYSNNGSMKFEFTGLELDSENKQYEFGFTKTKAEAVTTWYDILDFTDTTATINIQTTTKALRNVMNASDTGYITIREKDQEKNILKAYPVDLKIPYLRITNYTVIPNGKGFGAGSTQGIQMPIRFLDNSTPYYQYEKITDTNIINKYKEIKAKDGDYTELQSMLKTTHPTSGWTAWEHWNGSEVVSSTGYGYPQSPISLPDTGLYYMWIYSAGKETKDVYGYILVDNLEPDIALEGISLPKTETIELGSTRTLTITFNPSNATNKIVTWSSSDESVATVNNVGKITPKKIGSTIITVTSQEGNKKASCTVTVVAESSNSNSGNSGNTSSGSTNSGNSNSGSTNDGTVATGKLPQTGVETRIITTSLIVLISVGIFAYFKHSKLRGIH